MIVFIRNGAAPHSMETKMELKFWSKGEVARIYFGDEGYFERRVAKAYSRDANTFTNTVPADLFAKIVAFVGAGDDETVFQNLKNHAAGYDPFGMSAKATKVKKAEQKARIAAFAKEFA